MEVSHFCCNVSWTDVLTALGTVGAVLAALFGYFVPRWFPPRLRLASDQRLKPDFGVWLKSRLS